MELNWDDPGCAPEISYFPTSLWILNTIISDEDPPPYYFIIEDGVLYNTIAFCWFLDDDAIPA